MIRITTATCLLLGVTTNVLASVDSIGTNGINSTASMLTGKNVDIGQVELSRSGDPQLDSAGLHNDEVDPDLVLDRTFVNFQASQDISIRSPITNLPHATEVAGIIISKDPIAKGVAPDAKLISLSGSFTNVGGTPQQQLEGIYTQVAQSANHLATLPGRDVKAINLSIGVGGGIPNVLDGADGKSNLTSFIDWSSNAHDISYVVAGFEAGSVGIVPADNFNAITVGSSDKETGVYRRVGVSNLFDYDAAEDRTIIDIIAPSRDVLVATINNKTTSRGTMGGTSFAVPHVTGTLALLHEHANNEIMAGAQRFTANATKHEVMKALLLNSADKFNDNGTVQ